MAHHLYIYLTASGITITLERVPRLRCTLKKRTRHFLSESLLCEAPLCLWLLVTIIGCGGSKNGPALASAPNPIPAIASASPNTATAGSKDLIVTIIGRGFVTASVVEWNGGALATQVQSSTSLQAVIPQTDLSAPTNATLAVRSPPPGWRDIRNSNVHSIRIRSGRVYHRVAKPYDDPGQQQPVYVDCQWQWLHTNNASCLERLCASYFLYFLD